ncbi:4-azaleucine resistance probable transporter AzlC [Desulfacinum hydrothermale DSM 13146]|uniref:4-azaleucine resistance probable transporter AzlC n=1 Tax=Desulfacinum hydrothermale DSM 13146 TaxID=1121390 RepID=A0A1W1XHG6_9BACT|nr:AzlC family ABC transporter permease [Desulfacinum hydrothermale]SMC22951.1 4-azaleucine resistance probable transporter AzlC [Desulfacinum hydrothermale DSM 13146]
MNPETSSRCPNDPSLQVGRDERFVALQDVGQGFTANLPVAASVAAYGSVLGVLAVQKGISWVQLLVMNLSVFAGSAQFVMVDMWVPPLPIAEMTLAVLAINLRYLLIGASLEPVFRGASFWHKACRMHLVADENWAVTMAVRRRDGYVSTGFLLGGGLCVVTAWCLGTLSGHLLGAAIEDPSVYALDFAFVAVFTALAMSLWRGASDTVPWVVAAATAVVVERLLPGKWYIICGALAGSLVAACRKNRHGGDEAES